MLTLLVLCKPSTKLEFSFGMLKEMRCSICDEGVISVLHTVACGRFVAMSALKACFGGKKSKSPKRQSANTPTRQRNRARALLDFLRFGRAFRKDKPSTPEKEEGSKIADRRDLSQIARHELFCKDVVGAGTFGIVYRACPIVNPKDFVAVKRIELDEESETREVELHKMANHPNVVVLKDSWSTRIVEDNVRKSHIYMVMEYLPKTLEDYLHNYSLEYKTMPAIMIKVFAFQLFRGINYLHSIRILHRDIKPSNCLIDMRRGVLKVCDFGCAKRKSKSGGPNRTYICSRYYRAPELILNNTRNDENIDVWAAACVLAECFRGWPLFPGKTTKHQFGAIADVLGNPTPIELYFLNPKLKHLSAKIRDASGTFDEHFPPRTPESVMDLLARMLVYAPKDRVPLLAACADPYFDQLRLNVKTLILPSGARLPRLFDFSPQELQKASIDIRRRLIPPDKSASDVCYLDLPTYKKPDMVSVSSIASIDSMTIETESEDSKSEAFTEADSNDVDASDIFDCRKIRVIEDESESVD